MKKFLLILLTASLLLIACGCQNQKESAETIPTPVQQKELTKWDMIVQKQEIRIGVPLTESTFDNQLIDAFAKEAALTVTRVPLDWDDTMAESVRDGSVDMLWGQIPATSDFSTMFRLSHPYFHSTAVYVATSEETVLDHTTVIGALKHSAEASLVRHYYDNVLEFSTPEELFGSISGGQTQAIVYNKVLYDNLQIKKDAFVILKEVPYDLVLAFEQNNTTVAEEVEKILAKIKADGTATEICLQWYPEDLITK